MVLLPNNNECSASIVMSFWLSAHCLKCWSRTVQCRSWSVIQYHTFWSSQFASPSRVPPNDRPLPLTVDWKWDRIVRYWFERTEIGIERECFDNSFHLDEKFFFSLEHGLRLQAAPCWVLIRSFLTAWLPYLRFEARTLLEKLLCFFRRWWNSTFGMEWDGVGWISQ